MSEPKDILHKVLGFLRALLEGILNTFRWAIDQLFSFLKFLSEFEWHRLVERNIGWLLFVALSLGIGFIFLNGAIQEAPLEEDSWLLKIAAKEVLVVAASAFAIATLVLFTRKLETDSDANILFRFAYGFVLIVFTGSLWLLFNPGIFLIPPVQNDPKSDRTSIVVAILPGCDYESPPSIDPQKSRERPEKLPEGVKPRGPEPDMPPGVYCGDLPPQWVVSIGGNVLKCHVNGNCPRVESETGDADVLEVEEALLKNEISGIESDLASARKELTKIQILQQNNLGIDGYQSPQRLEEKIATLAEPLERKKSQLTELQVELSRAKDDEKLTNNLRARPIVGGIVVPLYFPILALFGALIGMMRRLPEYQEASSEKYKAEYERQILHDEGEKPPISHARARDYIIFQIVQVASAPLIAVVAYSFARPESVPSTAVLAFAAGFSSELFLIAIRSTAERLVALGVRDERMRRTHLVKASALGTSIGVATPSSAGGFSVGDAVTLRLPIGIFRPGTRGKVFGITQNGELMVETTHDHVGNATRVKLTAHKPEFFRKPGTGSDDFEKASG
jgi:hypothetical protein